MPILTTPSAVAFQLSAFGPGKQRILAVLAKRTYRLAHRRRCVPADEQLPLRLTPLFDVDRRNLLITDVDTYPWKFLTDVVIRGHVYAGELKTSVRAEVAVGSVVKALSVFGDRRCTRGVDGQIKFSDPEPFEKIPLEYDRAYGGWDELTEARRGHPLAPLAGHAQENTDLRAYSPFVYPRNRHGRGYLVEATPEGLDRLLLPNLEDPVDLLTPERLVVGSTFEWHKMPLPCGTTWVPPSYFARGAFLGIYPFLRKLPDTLMEFKRALLPREVNDISVYKEHPLILRFTNGASLGLQVPYLRPGAVIALTQLHPMAPRLEFEVPDDTPKISVDGRNGKLVETAPVIHHVEIEPDLNRVSIVWRGAAPAMRPYFPEELEKMPFRVEWIDG